MHKMMKIFMTYKCKLLLLLLLQPVVNASSSSNSNSSINSSSTSNTTCKHATDMWGDANPNIFYICDASGQQPLQLQCPAGRGFFNGLGYLGCLPYTEWPACKLPTLEQAGAQLAAGCISNDGIHVPQPWATLEPNKFYMCPSIGATPLLLNCAAGKGFVQTADVVGCADWLHWRRQLQCEQYY